MRRIFRNPLGKNHRIPRASLEKIPLGEARNRITKYLQNNPGVHYPSDIAFKLGLDLELVFKIIKALITEGIVEEVEKPRKVIIR